MKTWLIALTSILISVFASFSSFAAELKKTDSQLTIAVDESPLQAQLLNNPHPNYDHYYSYNFGQVPVNSIRYAHFTLTSTGYQPLYINAVRLYGQGFYGNTNCPYVLPPRHRCDAWVEFRPWYEGNYSGQLIFSTNAGNFIINLYGWGTRW